MRFQRALFSRHLNAAVMLVKHQSSCASAGNGLDVSAYRCVDVAGRNRQNSSASIVPVRAGCHPARATDNVERSKRFRNFVRDGQLASHRRFQCIKMENK